MVPYQWRHSGPPIDVAYRSRSFEQVKKRGRWQVMKTVQRYERHSLLGQSWAALPERVRLHLLRCDEQLLAGCATMHTRLIWDLLAFLEMSLRGPHRLWHQTGGCGVATAGRCGTHVGEKKAGRLREACGAPHVSEEALKVLRRLRPLQGPLLVECGRPFLSRQEVIRMQLRPEVEPHKLPSSRRRQHGAKVILSSHVDPSDLHGAVFWYSSSSRRCLKREPTQHPMRVGRSLACAPAEPLRQDVIRGHMLHMLPTNQNLPTSSHPTNN